MSTETKHPLIPEQETGKSSDNECSVHCSSIEQACALFDRAKARLLNVNDWEDVAEGISAKFVLTDSGGHTKDAGVEVGDFFRIEIPGPRSTKGADWVRVESVEDNTNHNSDAERFLIRVRPASSPVDAGSDTAHFFDDSASSNFLIEREGLLVRASVHGRNEKPNTESGGIVNSIRNAVTAITAIFGASDIQWKNLVKGLLHENK